MGSTRWRCGKRSTEENHRRSTRIPKQMEVKRSLVLIFLTVWLFKLICLSKNCNNCSKTRNVKHFFIDLSMSLQVADLKEKEREIKLPRLGLLKEKYSFRARRLNLIVMRNVMKLVHLVSFFKSLLLP